MMNQGNVIIERKDKTTFEADPSYVETPEFQKLKRSHGLKVVEREPEAQPPVETAPVDTKEPEKESKSKPSEKDKDAK